jgi:hypothetical protein
LTKNNVAVRLHRTKENIIKKVKGLDSWILRTLGKN